MKIEEYQPIGNTFLCKPIALEKNEFIPEHMQEKIGFKIVCFGSAYKSDEDLQIGDVVLVSGDKESNTHSDKLLIDAVEYWAFSPDMVIAKVEGVED